MRVGIVCPYDLDVPGGVQQLCLELGERLRGAGHDAVVVGPGSGESGDGTVRVGGSVGIRANRSVAPVALAPGAWGRAKAALADVDVVHIHEPLVPVVGWAALSVSKPTVATFHADAPNWVGRGYRLVPGQTLRKSVLTAVSPAAAAAIPSGWGGARIIPNAIDVGAYLVDVERLSRRISFLGRDEPRKGLDIALGAFGRIHEEHPEAELMVMGADRSDDIPGVHFLGRVTGEYKRRVLASSAIFVAPNTGGESFGIVLAEAMAAGCAVIASDLDAFRAVAGDNAVYFPVGDDAALAAELARLLSSEGERNRLRESARETVRAYDWSRVLAMYLDAYADAVVIRERE